MAEFSDETSGLESPSAAVVLRPARLSWLNRLGDDAKDLCAHGRVDFRVGSEVLVEPECSDDVTVSAAALYLLRTLSRDHSASAPVGDHLFPCCGFEMIESDESPDVVIFGCPNGIDFEVLHVPGAAEIIIRSSTGRDWRVPEDSWRRAVQDFADRVSAFYSESSPEDPPAEDGGGFRRFVEEWERRRGRPFASRPGGSER